jgi:hypothetical protein
MIDPNKADNGYIDGYTDGYSWLTEGANFRHPSEPKGYIPGGPYVFTASRSDKEDIQAKARMSKKYHDDWMKGWVDGINKYVRDNKLDYPQIGKG